MSLAPRRLCATGIIAAAVVLVAGAARADALDGTRGGRMRERGHRIELRMEAGYATMVVRRTVHNAAARADEASYDLVLPDLAVATGLRLRGKARWYEGELLAAPLAWHRYHALTGVDPRVAAAPGDLALLGTREPGVLSLDLFPVPAGRDRTVEYTVDMPAYWAEGRWRVDLEPTGLEEAPAELFISAVDRSARLFVDDRPVEHGHRVLLDDDHTVALMPRARREPAVDLAALDTGGGRTLVHWRVALPAKLTRIPARLRVVIALDLSRSLADGVEQAQRRAALAYLEHMRGSRLAARVVVLGFDRRVHTLSGGWVSAERAIAALRAASFERGNGSDVALALREAGELLATQPEGLPRRVLVLTDFLTASARTLAEHEAAAVHTGAIVHLAAVDADTIGLDRDDGHAWAPVAERTQGVVWRAAAAEPEGDEDRAAMRSTFEAWARPLRIDSMRIELGGPAHDDPTPGTLAEGEVGEGLLLVRRPVDELTVHGLTWNIPYVHTARRSGPLSRRWGSLLFGSPVVDDLDEHEQVHLARGTRAVTALTSYLITAPGAGPSREGFERETQRVALIGKGGGGGSGTGRGLARSIGFGGRLDRQAWLEHEIADRWRRCGGVGRAATIDIEATYEEIVDFSVLAPGSDAPVVACMREATWTLLLPAADFVDRRSRWRVRVAA